MKGILDNGRKALIAEIVSAAPEGKEALLKRVEGLKGTVDAVLIQDAPQGHITLCGTAVGALLEKTGLPRILNINARDRNRVALQCEVAGAVALGIKNVLFSSGEHPQTGVSGSSKKVYDLDPVQMVCLFHEIGAQKKFPCGEATPADWELSIGVEATAFCEPAELYQIQLQKKIDAGAEFLVTAPVFDVARFEEWVKALADKKVKVIATVALVDGQADTLKLRGTYVPQALAERVAAASDPEEERVQVAVEILKALKEMAPVAGINFSLPGKEELIGQLIEKAGLK